MEVLEERLNSFRNQKRFKWPLPASWRVNPETLARAGYYFKPQARNDDTAECFICQKSLGGWEENDDPYQEHRSHQASCPLCRLHDKDARMVTFDTWPDKRRGYKAFVKKLVDAGFFFWPVESGSDQCVCYYCGTAVCGWSAKDDPADVHERRCTGCPGMQNKSGDDMKYIKLLGSIPFDAPMAQAVGAEVEAVVVEIKENTKGGRSNRRQAVVVEIKPSAIEESSRPAKSSKKSTENVAAPEVPETPRRSVRGGKRASPAFEEETEESMKESMSNDNAGSEGGVAKRAKTLEPETPRRGRRAGGRSQSPVEIAVAETPRRATRRAAAAMESLEKPLEGASVAALIEPETPRRRGRRIQAAEDFEVVIEETPRTRRGGKRNAVAAIPAEVEETPMRRSRRGTKQAEEKTEAETETEEEKPKRAGKKPRATTARSRVCKDATAKSSEEAPSTSRSTSPESTDENNNAPEEAESAAKVPSSIDVNREDKTPERPEAEVLDASISDTSLQHELDSTWKLPWTSSRKSEICINLAKDTHLPRLTISDPSLTVEAYLRQLIDENVNLFQRQASELRLKIMNDVAEMKARIDAVPVQFISNK